MVHRNQITDHVLIKKTYVNGHGSTKYNNNVPTCLLKQTIYWEEGEINSSGIWFDCERGSGNQKPRGQTSANIRGVAIHATEQTYRKQCSKGVG